MKSLSVLNILCSCAPSLPAFWVCFLVICYWVLKSCYSLEGNYLHLLFPSHRERKKQPKPDSSNYLYFNVCWSINGLWKIRDIFLKPSSHSTWQPYHSWLNSNTSTPRSTWWGTWTKSCWTRKSITTAVDRPCLLWITIWLLQLFVCWFICDNTSSVSGSIGSCVWCR